MTNTYLELFFPSGYELPALEYKVTNQPHLPHSFRLMIVTATSTSSRRSRLSHGGYYYPLVHVCLYHDPSKGGIETNVFEWLLDTNLFDNPDGNAALGYISL